MLILLNTAKTFSSEPAPAWIEPTLPFFEAQSEQLAAQLGALSVPELAALMKISPALAQQNHRRYAQWSSQQKTPALHAFAGEIYKKLKATALTHEDWKFAQRHLRILSGLYGLLKPMDAIQPYRLEMYTKLALKGKKDLYDFWKPLLAARLNGELEESKPKILVNLASEEYFSAVDTAHIRVPIVTVAFQEKTAKGLRTVAIRSKWARGLMARYIVDRRITEPEGMKAFDQEGYRFDEGRSRKDFSLFVRG